MACKRVDLGQRLQYEARVIVIDEVAHTIDGIKPSSGPRWTMVRVMRRIVSGSTGSFRIKLNWPQIPHMIEER
jgi:hypothetical protein